MSRPRILVPGKINPRVLERLPEMFETVRIERADAALVTADMRDVSGIAVSGKLPVPLMDAFPASRSLRISASATTASMSRVQQPEGLSSPIRLMS